MTNNENDIILISDDEEDVIIILSDSEEETFTAGPSNTARSITGKRLLVSPIAGPSNNVKINNAEVAINENRLFKSPIAGPSKIADAVTEHKRLETMSYQNLVVTINEFDCPICMTRIPPGKGIVLHSCLHEVCRECLVQHIKFMQTTHVPCPFINEHYLCMMFLQQREIKALLDLDSYARRLAMIINLAEKQIDGSYHCRTPDCDGWGILEKDMVNFVCPICNVENCVLCKAIHQGITCQAYKALKNMSNNERKNHDFMDRLVWEGLAMHCPRCKVLISKIEGCDWCICSICNTEICWATRGPRWGPDGHGDETGGCRCRVNGQLCAPNCRDCH